MPNSGLLAGRLMIGEPHTLQKPRRNPGEDSKYLTRSSPRTHRKSSMRTRARLRNAALCAFRHLEQWQWPARISGPVISYLTPPHRQLPRMTDMHSSGGVETSSALDSRRVDMRDLDAPV